MRNHPTLKHGRVRDRVIEKTALYSNMIIRWDHTCIEAWGHLILAVSWLCPNIACLNIRLRLILCTLHAQKEDITYFHPFLCSTIAQESPESPVVPYHWSYCPWVSGQSGLPCLLVKSSLFCGPACQHSFIFSHFSLPLIVVSFRETALIGGGVRQMSGDECVEMNVHSNTANSHTNESTFQWNCPSLRKFVKDSPA